MPQLSALTASLPSSPLSSLPQHDPQKHEGAWVPPCRKPSLGSMESLGHGSNSFALHQPCRGTDISRIHMREEPGPAVASALPSPRCSSLPVSVVSSYSVLKTQPNIPFSVNPSWILTAKLILPPPYSSTTEAISVSIHGHSLPILWSVTLLNCDLPRPNYLFPASESRCVNMGLWRKWTN